MQQHYDGQARGNDYNKADNALIVIGALVAIFMRNELLGKSKPMKTYIAVLRGINVSGQKIIKMAELREHLQQLDIENTQTYIQSGNIIFNTKIDNPRSLETNIKNLIFEKWGFDVPVIVRELDDLRKIKTDNPFNKNQDIDPARLSVVFLSNEPDMELIMGLSAFRDPIDTFEIKGREIYLHCPNGFGRSKLTTNFFERKLKVICTARNLKTLNRLIEIGEKVKGN
ncbi:MAG: DUF1697 domain-containing protein [Chlorobi bacterium]|nr:DUF1697 domain-containing protein [Chlorobiota bacterium]